MKFIHAAMITFIFGILPFFAPCQKIFLTPNADRGCLMTTSNGIKPGDTLVLSEKFNPWSYVYIGGISGSSQHPVVIINDGDVLLTSGFDVENSRHIKLSGKQAKSKRGFLINGSGGVAVTIHGKSSHIEVENFMAKDCNFGCWIKNEADCDTSINNWVLDDISIHDYELSNIKIEGFYLGSTDADNSSRPKNCNGVQQYYRPSQLSNIKIFNGLIDGTGRPAIMLSNARAGNNEIHHNVIRNVGREYSDQQGTGISLGLYTRAYVHHNVISNTLTWGIASLGGSGLIRIENNRIENSGSLDGKKVDWAQNISIDTRRTQPADSTTFVIINNVLKDPGGKAKHIQIWNSEKTYTSRSVICNNQTDKKIPATIGLAEGITWLNCKKLEHSRAEFGIKKGLMVVLASGALILAIFLVVRNYSRKKNPGQMARVLHNKQASSDSKA